MNTEMQAAALEICQLLIKRDLATKHGHTAHEAFLNKKLDAKAKAWDAKFPTIPNVAKEA